MDIKCKNCGKVFELSDGEIDFFKSKNLQTPKRCKECRQAKRNNIKTTQTPNQYINHNRKTPPKQYVDSSILSKFIIVAFILITAIVAIPNLLDNETSTPIVNYENASTFEFRNEDYLSEHFEKHGIGMGYNSASEYLQGANDVIGANNVMTKTQSDSDTAYFLQSSGEFVVISYDGYIRTYFIPEDGIEYFNRQ